MASGKTLQSTIEISGVLSPSLQKAIAAAVNKLEEMSEETLASVGAAEKLTAEIGAQESVLKNLRKGYADFVVSGQESSDEARTLASKIQELSGELDENRDALQAAEKAAMGLTQEQGDTADAFSKLEKKINSQEAELSALKREYANVALEQGESSDEARQLAAKISDLSGELNENKNKLKDAERAADSFGDALEDAGQKAEDSSGGYTILKDVIADLASSAIQSAIEGFKELALEGDTALGKLEARTGATSKEMEGFEDVMYEVYNSNYGENLGDVSEKLSTVIQMTDDLDNASLAKVTKNAIALEDVFGFDVTESMRAVNSLMDKFGVTSDEAFNLIVQGAQNGLNQNDDLLDTINEYSVQFKNAGYSADDMFNMLANGASTGTWSVDKLGDAVKEFNIRASDGTVTDALVENAKAFGFSKKEAEALGKQVEGGSVEAYQKLLEKLKEVDDDAQRYQLGVSMFGTMWEDLGEETVLALMSTQGELSKTADAMDKMDSAAYDTLESSLSQLGRTIKSEVLQPIVDKLTPAIKTGVDYLNAKVGPAVDWLLAHLPEVGIVLSTIGAVVAAAKWGSIVAKLTQIIGAVKTFASGIAAALAGISAPVLIAIGVVALLAAAFTHLWRNNEEFRDKVVGIWEGIKSKFESFTQGIVDRLNALGFDFSSFGEVVGAIWDGFCNLLAPIFEGAFQHISNVLGFAFDTLTGLFDVFSGIFTGDWDLVWQGVQEIFGGAWDFVVNTFKNVLNMLKGIADTVLGWFGTSWSEVWTSISTFFVEKWNGIVSFFSGIWTSITSFCSSAWETIKNVVKVGIMFVKSIISGAFQLITLPFRFIWENCKDTVLKAWNWIKDTIGNKITAAKEKITAVTTAIKNVAGKAWSAVSSAASQKWESIKNAIGNKISAAKEKITAVTSAIKNVASKAWSAVSSTASQKWESIKNTVGNKISAAKEKVSSVANGIRSTMSSVFGGALSKVQSIFGSIYNSIKSKIDSAKEAVRSAINKIKGFFNFSWSLPKIKLPHFSIDGKFSLNPPSVPKLSIDWYKDGGILTQPTIFGASGNTLSVGGEAGPEAVLPLSVLWKKMQSLVDSVYHIATTTGEPTGEGLTAQAGKLLTLDDFSLGSLANGTNVVIYYDFSNFTWSPQIHADGVEDEDDFMAKLRAHEAEFFDWLEEFIKMREVAQYA